MKNNYEIFNNGRCAKFSHRYWEAMMVLGQDAHSHGEIRQDCFNDLWEKVSSAGDFVRAITISRRAWMQLRDLNHVQGGIRRAGTPYTWASGNEREYISRDPVTTMTGPNR